MKMTKMLLGIGVAIGMLATANPSGAADVPYYKAGPQAQVFNWSGFYVKGDLGYITGDIDYSIPGGSINVNPQGYTFGAGAGYLAHLNSNWLVGIEGDFNYADVDRTTAVAPGIGLTGGFDYYSTVRGLIGYSFGSWMIHANGGWAGFSAQDFQSGWAYGVGTKIALTRNLWLTADYQRLVFDGTANFGPASLNTDGTSNLFKVGLNYRFGG